MDMHIWTDRYSVGIKALWSVIIVCGRGAGDILTAGVNVRNERSAGIDMGDKHSYGSTIWLLFTKVPSFTKDISLQVNLLYFGLSIGKCTFE